MQNADGSFGVARWPRGESDRVTPPPLDSGGDRYNGLSVVAVFHTHPNPPMDEEGREWEQEPSASDRRWHGRRRLRGFVISQALVYDIGVNTGVTVIGRRDEVLG